MERFLLKEVIYISFLICFTVNVNAQYTITGNVNSSVYSCATFSGNSIIYIGDGTMATSLLMNATLDLYNSCSLGPIQFIIRNNASVDFSPGNNRLILPVGSSIIIEQGGNLIGGSCNASERIYIGTDLIASCNGGAGADYAFNELILNGGHNYIKATVSPICGSGAASIAVSVIPTPSASTTYRLYNAASGGSVISSVTSTTNPYTATITTPAVALNTTYYVAATTGSVTTPRREVAVIVNTIPTITGTTSSSVCGPTAVTLGATASSGTINWYAAATGGSSLSTGSSFTTAVLSGTTTYYVSATNSGCTTATRTAVVATINPVPVITSQPINQLDCEGSSVKFKVIASGLGLSYTWQRKKPTDASFVTIPVSETNTAYPSVGEIKIDNVGSTQYPDGTQFQVIVSNGICSVTSTGITLSVNEITAITPNTTNVVRCYGANYSYTLTTSYPANVVSYQWKKSVTSGVWDVVNNGGAYSGATTANLVITGGTPNESAEYRVYITFNNSTTQCSVDSSTRTRKITFLPQLTMPVTMITQPSCLVDTGTIITTVQSATDTYSFDNGLAFQASNVKSGLSAGSYNVIIKNIGGCLSATNTVIIDSQPLSITAPVVGAIIQPDCSLETASVTLSGLPSGAWTLTRSGTSAATITGTGSDVIILGLPEGGNYTFIVSSGSCTSAPSTNVSINSLAAITSTWDGSVWINGAPDSSKKVVFNGDFSSTSNLDACSCQVAMGATVVINSEHTLKVVNSVNVHINGMLLFENNASLVQVNDVAINTGNINYKRYTAPVKRYDFTYWSSPVAGQTLKKLSPTTLFDKYYSYNNGWIISYNGVATMEAGKGYLIRAPQTFSTTLAAIDNNPVFVGVPNNGIINLALTANTAYLLGNPYPSAIDADMFLDTNSAVLEGTLYFWTHNTSPSDAIGGTAAYNYTTNDYATYNRTGGVSTKKAAASGGFAPTAKIAAAQGFFAPAKATANVVFNNNMRIVGGTAGVDNSQFFRPNSISKITTTPIEKNRIWLNLMNNEGVFKQTLVGYVSEATNFYDAGFDGISYDGNQYVDFYSINQTMNLSIQGRALPFQVNDSIKLGYKSTIKGEFQINIDHIDGVLTTQNVFLEDNDLQLIHDLKKEPYVFTTETGVFNNRFVLRYQDKNTTKKMVKTIIVDNEDELFVSSKNNEIKLSSLVNVIVEVNVYNVSGQLIYQNKAVKSNNLIIRNLNLAPQMLIVQAVLLNGKTISTKLLY